MSSAPRLETVNSELLSLTYGALVAQLVRDFEDPKEVNAQLEQMGYNIGVRLVDEFCAKSRAVRCRNFRETMDTVAKEAFRMFLGVAAVAGDFAADNSSCTLRIPDNPLAGAPPWACLRLPPPPISSPPLHTRTHLAPFFTPPSPPLLLPLHAPQTLWNCPRLTARCGTATYYVASFEAHWKWCRCG